MDQVKDALKKRMENWKRLEQETRDLCSGFDELMMHSYEHGALERKSKELMAVSASVATRCISYLANHANNAVSAGATRNEGIDAAAIGVEFGGGPSFVVVREHLLQFLNEIEAAK